MHGGGIGGKQILAVCNALRVAYSQDEFARLQHELFRLYAEGTLSSILQYCEAPLVSSDIVGNPRSAILDPLSTQAQGDGFARVVAWYDNEWGYSQRVVDLLFLLSGGGAQPVRSES